MSLYSRIPYPFGRDTLSDDGDAGEKRDECGSGKKDPNDGGLDLCIYDPKKEGTDGAFARPKRQESRNLAEYLVHERRIIGIRVANVRVSLAQAVPGRHMNKDSVYYVENLRGAQNISCEGLVAAGRLGG